jgi:hypothetical protein
VDITVLEETNAPPVCVAKIHPSDCVVTNNGTNTVIALSEDGSCLILDASQSSDADGDPLTFTWTIDGTNVYSGAVITNCFDVGCHEVVLEVSDGRVMCRKEFTLCVVSPCEMVEECIMLVENTPVSRKNKRPLITSLKQACDKFDRGDLDAAINILEAFIHKVQAQIARSNPAEAQAFTECAMRIIDAVQCSAEMAQHGNNGLGNGEDPQPPGNPPRND